MPQMGHAVVIMECKAQVQEHEHLFELEELERAWLVLSGYVDKAEGEGDDEAYGGEDEAD